MNVLFLTSLIINLYMIDSKDPDEQLCDDLSIDAAVSADDDNDYVFKGDYYWRLNTETGIFPNYGELIGEHWKGLSSPIDAAFTIEDKSYGFSTVFIKGNQWFLYKKGTLQLNGTTDKWPQFPKYKIMDAFNNYNGSIQRKDRPIYFMYNSEDFSTYYFRQIQSPEHIFSGKAYRKNRFFIFLSDPTVPMTDTIKDYINVTAVIANKNHIVFFGDKDFCNITQDKNDMICAKPINIAAVNTYFNCPRKPRPTTTTTTTTTSTTTSTTSTPITSTTATEQNSSNDLNSTEFPTNEETIETIAQSLITTGISDNTTDYWIQTSSDTINIESSNESNDSIIYWTFIIPLIVIITLLCVISLVVIIFAIRSKKKTKASEENVHKKQSRRKNTMNDVNEEALDKTVMASNRRTDSNESLMTAMKTSRSALMDIEDTDSQNDFNSNSRKKSPENKEFRETKTEDTLTRTPSNESLGTAMQRSKSSLIDSPSDSQSNNKKTESDELN